MSVRDIALLCDILDLLAGSKMQITSTLCLERGTSLFAATAGLAVLMHQLRLHRTISFEDSTFYAVSCCRVSRVAIFFSRHENRPLCMSQSQ